MSYYVHITRRSHWADKTGPVISLYDLATLLADDPELVQDDDLPLVAWVSNGVDPRGYFEVDDGCITAPAPDEGQLAKMIAMAAQLGARVQGDGGEFYDLEGERLVVDRGYGWRAFEVNWPEERFTPTAVVPRNEQRSWMDAYADWMGRAGLVLGTIAAILWVALKYQIYQEEAEKERAKQAAFDASINDMREHVQRGEAGDAFSRLFGEDHAIYQERAKAGDPAVRPMDKDPYEYMIEQANEQRAQRGE